MWSIKNSAFWIQIYSNRDLEFSVEIIFVILNFAVHYFCSHIGFSCVQRSRILASCLRLFCMASSSMVGSSILGSTRWSIIDNLSICRCSICRPICCLPSCTILISTRTNYCLSRRSSTTWSWWVRLNKNTLFLNIFVVFDNFLPIDNLLNSFPC